MFTNDPAFIDTAIDSRSISFENPRGERGRGGTAASGRKGSPSRFIPPGDKVKLVDIEGPGRIHHVWMTFPPADPEQMRSVMLDVYYDDLKEPSVSVPCLDFFGLPHGRAVPYFSALTSVAEGRGFNAYFPMPFHKRIRMEVTNGRATPLLLFYQVDYRLRRFRPNQATCTYPSDAKIPQLYGVTLSLRAASRALGDSWGVQWVFG